MDGGEERVPVRFGILGPLRVIVRDEEVAIPARRQRALLLLLLLHVGKTVPADRLIDQLWDGEAPPQAAVTLRSYISNLRQALKAKGAEAILVTRASGYAIDVPPQSIDATRMQSLAEHARELLQRGEAVSAFEEFEDAVRLWGGAPLAEIADHQFAQSTIVQLNETYLAAVEGRLASMLELGRHIDAIPGLEALTAEHPLREEPRALLIAALHRAGRTSDALEAHRTFRVLLQDELGLDPPPRLDRVLRDILDPVTATTAASPERGPASATATTPQAPTGPRGRIVGRERELASLGAQIDTLLARRRGALAIISGEPGIGKSTLLDWMQARGRAHGLAVHSGRVPAAAGAPAFWPWAQVIESIAATMTDSELQAAVAGVAGAVGQLAPSISARTHRVFTPTGDDVQSLRFAVYESVREFVTRACEGVPLVIALDDIQWADAESLELISYLSATPAAHPLLLAVAYRSLPSDRTDALEATLATLHRGAGVEEFRLTGLSRDAISEIVADLASERDAINDRVLDAIVGRAGGNPLFVRQLAGILDDEEWMKHPENTPVPLGIRHLVARRLQDIQPVTRRLVDAASVIGREFPLRTTAAVAGLTLEEALDAFDNARAHGVFEDSPDRQGMRRFVHALVQETVVEQLSTRTSVQLHAAAGNELALDGSVPPDVVAEHFWAARELVGDRAVPALIAAADAAGRLYSYEKAELNLRRAHTIASTSAEIRPRLELTILLRLLQVISVGKGWGDANVSDLLDRSIAITEAETLQDDTVRLWWSLFFFFLDRDDSGSFRHAASTLLAALAEVDAGCAAVDEGDHAALTASGAVGHAARAAIHLMAIFECVATDERTLAERHLRAARVHVELAPPESLAAYPEHLHVMLLLIEAYWSALLGKADGYESAVAAAVALADADGRPFVRTVARTIGVSSLPLLLTKPTDEHRRRILDALSTAAQYGFTWLERLSTVYQGWMDASSGGDTGRAAAALEAFVDDLTMAGHLGNRGIVLLLLADVWVWDGRPEEARQAIEAALLRPGPYAGLMRDVLHRRQADLRDM